MLVRHREADTFLKKSHDGVGFYLLFGTDEGLVHERSRAICSLYKRKSAEETELIQFDGDQLAGDPGLLVDEVCSLGLFAQKKVVLISAGSKNFVPAIELCSEGDPKGTPVIILAGALRPDHQLRKLFERDRKMVAIECYPDSVAELRSLIQNAAAEHGMKIAPAPLNDLSLALGEDRLSTRMELEKLFLYCTGQSTIEADDITQIGSDTSDPMVDELTGYIFGRSRKQASGTIVKLLRSGHDPSVLLGNLLRYGALLCRAKVLIDDGEQQDAALQKASRLLGFFGRTQKADTHIRMWSSQRLLRAVQVFSICIERVRREPKLSHALTVRAVWSVSS